MPRVAESHRTRNQARLPSPRGKDGSVPAIPSSSVFVRPSDSDGTTWLRDVQLGERATLRFKMVTSWTLGPLGFTDRRSTVLRNVHCHNLKWWAQQDSNLRPADYESGSGVRNCLGLAKDLNFRCPWRPLRCGFSSVDGTFWTHPSRFSDLY